MYPESLEEIDQLILPADDGGIWLGYKFMEDMSLFVAKSNDQSDLAFNGFFIDHRNPWYPCSARQSHWLTESDLAIAMCVAHACRWDEVIDSFFPGLEEEYDF